MKELLQKIYFLKNTMVDVSTGRRGIDSINFKYQEVFQEVSAELNAIGIDNPNSYSDLWDWYQYWSSGDLPRYQDRRNYIANLFDPLFKQIKSYKNDQELEIKIQGWNRIERSSYEIKKRLPESTNEEQFQAIGLLCRETIISLAQEVYDEELHSSIDGKLPSKTDSKRMLEAYISTTLPGKRNETLRQYAKATNALSNELTHKRTANSKDARLCASATINLINLLRILEEEDDFRS